MSERENIEMDREKNEVDDDRSISKKEDQSTTSSSTVQEGSTSTRSPAGATPPSIAVPKGKEVIEKKEPNSVSSSFSCHTKTTTISGYSNVVEKAAEGNKQESEEKEEKHPFVSAKKADTTRVASSTTTTKTTTTKDDDRKIQNKIAMSSTSKNINNNTTMSDHSLSLPTCKQDDNTNTTYDTTSNSELTLNKEDLDVCREEKVLDESIDTNKTSNSSSQLLSITLQPNQQVKESQAISCERNTENIIVGSTSAVSVSTPTATISKNNNSNQYAKMDIVVSESETLADVLNKDDAPQSKHGSVPPTTTQENTKVGPKEDKNAAASSVVVIGEERVQNKSETESSSSISIVANTKDTSGVLKKEVAQLGKTTCPKEPPERIGSSDDIHHSENEGNIRCSSTNNTSDDNNQQVKITNNDGRSLNQVASQNNPESSPVKSSASLQPTPALDNPLNELHKNDLLTQNNENTLPLANEPSGKTSDTVPGSTLQSTLSPPPQSKLVKNSSDSSDIMKPSTNSSIESAGSQLQCVDSGTISASPLKQPLEKTDSSRITVTAPTQTVQSSADDSSKRFPNKDLEGASQTAKPIACSSSGSNNKPTNQQCVQGQDNIADSSILSKGSPELTNLSSARSEVPKKADQDAAITVKMATLSLSDNVNRDMDEHSSKRSDSDSQDVTPSDSLSIPSDRDLEVVDIASLGPTDNDAGAASLKVTKDGASSSSSSSVLSIYHLKWIHFKSKKIPVITQNENGPCPLLAIMNVLLLQGRVTLESGLELITSEQLMDHLDECILENVPKSASEDVQLNYQQNMQDGMAVIHKLQTGLDVNVRFTGVQDFEYTTECILFDLLGISLYHGWLVDPQSYEVVSAIGMCSYNQLVEKIIVQKTSDDTKLINEATIAENFLEKTASQLTYHGLCELSTTVKEGELCVFFRNNHFSTLYRHKNELFLLVTDQGFLNEFNVVWETLSSVEGDCYFVDAEFNTYTKPDPVSGNCVVTPPVVPIGSDQQIDQDYLVALSLEREQQLREVWTNAGGTGIGSGGLGAGAAQPDPLKGPHVQLSDLELAKKLQDEENQRAASASNRRNPRPAADPCTSSGTRRTREREKDKDGCLIL